MIGDLWASPRTGRIYRDRASEHPLAGRRSRGRPRWVRARATSGLRRGAIGLGVLSTVAVAAFLGFVLGAVLMALPVAYPLSVPALFVVLLVVGIRSLVTRRSLRPVMLARMAWLVLLAVVVPHVIF